MAENVSGTLCILGGIGVSGLIAAYGIYMGLGPGGDGIIFASVSSGIVAIIAGIGGFKLARIGFISESPPKKP